MKRHSNANENDADHHLYEIRDTYENDTFKYGICGKPLLPDGSSPRANEQTRDYNRAFRIFRFIAIILRVGIPGRRRAKEIEDEYINAYIAEHGRRPHGNP